MMRSGNKGSIDFLRTILVFALLCFTAAAASFPPRTFCQERASADTPPKKSSAGADVFLLNEDLIYEVSWMSIPLGSIRTIVTRVQGKGDEKIVTATAYIRSYSGVPFVDLYEVDETTMDHDGIPFSFRAREKADDKWKFTDYTFDQQKHRLFAKERVADSENGNGSVLNKFDSVSIANNCVDGLSLLYYARINARTNKQASVPTYLKGKQGTTSINFYRKATSTDIDAVDYPVDVIELDGNAGFSGILGMTGEFTGWFSNDNAQIPIKGKMKIFLGSVTVELKEWHRSGWNPPRYASAR